MDVNPKQIPFDTTSCLHDIKKKRVMTAMHVLKWPLECCFSKGVKNLNPIICICIQFEYLFMCK